MTNSPDIEAFARRSIAALPDSMTARINDLQVLIQLLPAGTEGRRVARELLLHLKMQARVQLEFTMEGKQ